MKMADVPFLHLSLNSRSSSSKSFGTIWSIEAFEIIRLQCRDFDRAIWFAKRFATIPIAIINR